MMMRKILVAGVLVLSACGLINGLSASKVMVATLLHTPAIELKPSYIAGFDASIPQFDAGGFMFDAGGFDVNDAGITVPEQTAAIAYLGDRSGGDISTPPKGVEKATFTVKSGSTVTLKEIGAGSYQLLSKDEPALVYAQGSDVDFVAKVDGQTFTGRVEKVPKEEKIAAFHPAAGFIDLAAGTDFAFVRPDAPAGETRPLGFVVVVPISRDGKQGDPTYTNVPKTPVEFLKLVVAPGKPWQETQVTIPGSAFPDKEKNYVILLQSAKLGGPVGENLFTGSAIIAGTADVGIVKTRP